LTAYRFEELGWLQFQRLGELVLGLEGFSGSADRVRNLLHDGDLRVPGTDEVLPGPVLVRIVWRPEGRAVADEEPERARSALMLDSVPNAPAATDSVRVLGFEELGAIVDARAELRRRMPSVLGLRDLDPLLDSDAVACSSFDLPAAQALARVFVPTRAHAQTLDLLDRHRFAVITGPPEVGKTAIARMIGLAQATCGWEVHECTRPEELWQAFARDRSQLFVADDAFGSTEYRPEAAERWANELDRVLHALDHRHQLIWTSRPAPLRAGLRRVHRERGGERFPAPAEVHVDASRLDLEEKVLILFRHAKAAGLPAGLIRAHGHDIVSHPHFTPERVRRFVSVRLPELLAGGEPSGETVMLAVQSELETPTAAMSASFDALGEEHRALLVALLDAPSGVVGERELVAALRRHHPGLSQQPAELIDRLTDHFLKVTP
jgi:conflict system STAND superfamily ATPase